MRHRLILVDDELRNLALLKACLTGFDLEIDSYTDGRASLSAMTGNPPDLVLLDVMMPGFDGFDVLRHMRVAPALATVPVVLVTAHGERDLRLRGLQAGADDFLEKPIDSPILQARVRTLLRLKDHHDQLAQSNEQLRQAQQAHREMLGFIVHDLKTPLTAVFLTLQYGVERAMHADPDAYGMLCDGLTAAGRVRHMIDDLLDVSVLEESRMALRYETISVSSLLEVAAGVFKQQAAAKHIAIKLRSERPLQVDGDRTLLLRVIQNVLDNSMRFTPPDGRIEMAAQGDDDVVIVVSNTGPRIRAADQQRIFEKFVRDDSGYGGSAGLGLYFCRRALEAHHGAIRVVERPEWPASFEIRLPAAARGALE